MRRQQRYLLIQASGSNLTLGASFDGGDNFVGISRPCEGLWVCIGLSDEAVDGGREIDDGAEDTDLRADLVA
jgi:hypothetical protein